jgi:hypothetical protein
VNLIFCGIQIAGWIGAVIALIRDRGEDPRFAGDKLIYRS